MSPKPAPQLRSLAKIVFATLLLASCSNWAAAAPAVASPLGSGSMDDWLALGLAALAALYCVQKRE